jgi:hypothetical protein
VIETHPSLNQGILEMEDFEMESIPHHAYSFLSTPVESEEVSSMGGKTDDYRAF